MKTTFKSVSFNGRLEETNEDESTTISFAVFWPLLFLNWVMVGWFVIPTFESVEKKTYDAAFKSNLFKGTFV